MQVIYKKSIIEKINDEIYKAKKLDKEIDKIILTDNEYTELVKYLDSMCVFKIPPVSDYHRTLSFYGISVECEV